MMHKTTTPHQFRNAMLEELEFHAFPKRYYIHYENPESPENGCYHLYQREGYYDWGIADYTIHHAFSIQFHNPDPLLRLGVVYDGTTKFKLENEPVSSFQPSAFLVLEQNIRGRQVWKKGQHFKGAELTIYPAFLEELNHRFPDYAILDYFLPNHTYHYLPADVLSVIQRMLYLDQTDSLNALHLEATILECMGAIIESGNSKGANAFSDQVDFGSVEVGRNRRIHFCAEDYHAIQKAHTILTEQFVHPPTIDALSQKLLLSPQKLKSGFAYYYHITIGEYTAALRMDLAATLLCTTEKSVDEIAREVGYQYSANFIRKFQAVYHCTPLKYRMREKKSGKTNS